MPYSPLDPNKRQKTSHPVQNVDESSRDVVLSNRDYLTQILAHLPATMCRFAAPVNQKFRECYRNSHCSINEEFHPKTSLQHALATVDTARIFLHETAANDSIRTAVCQEVAWLGNLEVLKLVHGEGCPWDATTCATAAQYGWLGVLKWARSQGCPWDERTCSRAALGGQLDILKWARSQGCPWSETTCCFAASGGNLNVLKWVRSQGCPWDEKTCAHAAYGGHLDTLKWARSQGCPWDASTISAAFIGGHAHVLEWAQNNGCPMEEG